MTSVASRDLRNRTAEVLQQVADGERVTITVNGRPIAEMSPVRSAPPQFFDKTDLMTLLADHQADAGLTADLDELADDTTDDLDPLCLPSAQRAAVLDTSVLIAHESGRPLATRSMPERTTVCVDDRT